MKTEKQVLYVFKDWANRNENIRAALLTSSRADKNVKKDFLSDFDIELYVKDITTIKQNDDWLKPLGEIMVRWLFLPKPTFDNDWITRLILFNDGVRIDFQITDKMNARLDNIDYGYRILLDKDKILTHLPEPTNSKFIIKKPLKEEFETIVNEFWWDATYVPKYLWRDELPFAKSMMGQSVQDKYLRKIIEWYIGLKNDWSVSTGICGRHFKKYLESDIWEQFCATYSATDIEDNWKSFFISVELFSRLGKNIAKSLGFEYPYEIEKKMKEYYQKIKNEKIFL